MTDIESKYYSNASNARRAAKAAGIDAARVYKAADGCFKIRLAAKTAVAPTPAPEGKAPKAPKVAKAKTIAAPKAKRVAKVTAPKKAAASKAPAPGAKGAKLIEMITKGATISELMKALGWLPHTTRGAISRLGTDWGYNVERTKVGSESHYKIAS